MPKMSIQAKARAKPGAQVPAAPPDTAGQPERRAAHLLAGAAAEEAAARFLEAQGLKVLARNVRVPGGEIDIIALQGEVLVFCEVRWRACSDYGGALASIDGRKRARMHRAASSYLLRHSISSACRLDALCADGPPPFRWLWIRDL